MSSRCAHIRGLLWIQPQKTNPLDPEHSTSMHSSRWCKLHRVNLSLKLSILYSWPLPSRLNVDEHPAIASILGRSVGRWKQSSDQAVRNLLRGARFWKVAMLAWPAMWYVQLVEHAPPSIPGRAITKTWKTGTRGLSRVVLSANRWVQGNGSSAALPLTRHHHCSIHCENRPRRKQAATGAEDHSEKHKIRMQRNWIEHLTRTTAAVLSHLVLCRVAVVVLHSALLVLDDDVFQVLHVRCEDVIDADAGQNAHDWGQYQHETDLRWQWIVVWKRSVCNKREGKNIFSRLRFSLDLRDAINTGHRKKLRNFTRWNRQYKNERYCLNESYPLPRPHAGADLPLGWKGLGLGPPILEGPKLSGLRTISSIFVSNHICILELVQRMIFYCAANKRSPWKNERVGLKWMTMSILFLCRWDPVIFKV